MYMNKPASFQTMAGAFTIPAGRPGVSTWYNDPYHFSQTGYFGQTTIDFADFGFEGLRFTAGYRHSIVKNSLTAINATLTPGGIVQSTEPGIEADLKQTADSYTFAVDYRITPDVMVYGTTRRGLDRKSTRLNSSH